jgi:sodium/bile acid cotransporter 7
MAVVISIIQLFLLAGCDGTVPRAGADVGGPHADAQERKEIAAKYARYKQDFPDAPEVTASQLAAMVDDSAVRIVDVREADEIAVSIIPGAQTQEQFEKDSALYRSSKIVVYCTIGYRSGIYTDTLVSRGFDAYNLVGGVLEWAHENQRFVTPAGEPTDSVHVYGSEWDLLPEGYVSVVR